MIDFNKYVLVTASGEYGVVRAYLPRVVDIGFDYWVVELDTGGFEIFLPQDLEVV